MNKSPLAALLQKLLAEEITFDQYTGLLECLKKDESDALQRRVMAGMKDSCLSNARLYCDER